MISRVADHCFWFGRYVERAESTARVLQVTRTLALDAELPATQCWRPLVIVVGRGAAVRRAPRREARRRRRARPALHDLGRRTTRSASRSSVRAARENARSIREVLCLETWEAINELYLWSSGADAARAALPRRPRRALPQRPPRRRSSCLGLLRSTMLHDEPIDFLWLGVMLERVGQTARMLDVHHHAFELERERQDAHEIVETALWLSLLRACSGFEAFMKRASGARERAGAGLVPAVRVELSRARCATACARRARSCAPSGRRAGSRGRSARRRRGSMRCSVTWRRTRRSSAPPTSTRCSPTSSTSPPPSARWSRRTSWGRRPSRPTSRWQRPPASRAEAGDRRGPGARPRRSAQLFEHRAGGLPPRLDIAHAQLAAKQPREGVPRQRLVGADGDQLDLVPVHHVEHLARLVG